MHMMSGVSNYNNCLIKPKSTNYKYGLLCLLYITIIIISQFFIWKYCNKYDKMYAKVRGNNYGTIQWLLSEYSWKKQKQLYFTVLWDDIVGIKV